MEIWLLMALLANVEKITWKYLADPYYAGPKWRYEITLPHVCSPVNLQHIFGTLFPKNTSRWMVLEVLTMQLAILQSNFGGFL